MLFAWAPDRLLVFRRCHLLGSYRAGMATPDEFCAAAEVFRELGPEYSDAAAESFAESAQQPLA